MVKDGRFGFTGRYLRLDLTNKKTRVETLDKHLIDLYMGGRGIGSYFLYREVEGSVDPFDEKNKVIIAAGPLTGTGIPAGTKTTVITKSPLTNGITYALASGRFGPWLKFCGYDFLIVEGKAKGPTYVYIKDNDIAFLDAHDLWGLTTLDTRKRIAEKYGKDASTLCIGPAGENLVRYASVIMDRREAGRGGTGAVLGAKKLKAIVANPSQKSLSIYDKEKLRDLNKSYLERIKEDPGCQAYRIMGTSRSTSTAHKEGLLPTRNYQDTGFDEYYNLSGERLAEKFIVGHHTCYLCPVMCEKLCEVKEGEYAGAYSEGLEYESIWALGTACGNSSMESVIMANKLCDDLGLDTMSTGGTIAFAMECYEKGLLTDRETGGISLTFGNHKSIIEVIKRIARREGIGDLLAEGSRRAAVQIGKGAIEFSMSVKGQEMSGWDPRGAVGMALAYATANRGACHTTAAVFSLEIPTMSGKYGNLAPDPNKRYNQYSIEGKAELVKFVQDNRAALSALGACYFARPLNLDDYSEMFSAITGIPCSRKDLLRLGERIYTLERAFNVKAGMTRNDDFLPNRLHTTPGTRGMSKGHVVNRDDYGKMLDEYYSLRGWDRNGVPKVETVKELELAFLAEDFLS